ncbi:MAG TPA: shikimate kinase [Nitrosopumilaceae archaeon]|nr:shikimate kinase [Nitrosopumilaceae archaeon]
MVQIQATLHGAVSIVNAIATGKGATLGISLKTTANLETSEGNGITIESKNKTISSRLINRVIQKVVPKNDLSKTKIRISLESEIPTGYGLKSSSAISSAVSLACAKLFRPKWNDTQILLAGVDASIESRVSITGAYDDACGCYFGGFVVTENYKRKLVKLEKGPNNLVAVIFIPKSRKRGNVKNLKNLSPIFEKAWNLARNGDYWNAMVLNGMATSTILNSEPKMISDLIENGALGASISGNGPAIAAISKKEDTGNIKKIFSNLAGTTIISEINNKKAEVNEL